MEYDRGGDVILYNIGGDVIGLYDRGGDVIYTPIIYLHREAHGIPLKPLLRYIVVMHVGVFNGILY